MSSTAPISLDYTLHDLYSLDNDGGPEITLLYYPLQLDCDGTTTPVKFIYQYTLHAGPQRKESSIPLAAKIVPQRYGFSAGKMPLVIPDFSSPSCQDLGSIPTHLDDAYRVFSQLRSDQKPILSLAKSLRTLSLETGGQIAVLLPTDELSRLPHLIDPDIHYEILSKRGLALSELPTPPSEVIDSVLDHAHKHDPTRLKDEISRMIEPINKRKLPFMIKLPQSISGIGTAKVSTEVDRVHTKALLVTQLEGMLQQINASNHHLHPCSLVIQDVIQGNAMALSIFVTKKGRPIFIACCEQRFDEDGHWTGGSISYREQAAFSKMYADISEKVAAFLHRKGYYGPAGVDVISDHFDNKQYIVDLNVRVTGTYHLGPLAGHFTRRGLFEATMVTWDFSCSRAAFEEVLKDEIQNGNVIINGWAHESIRLSHGAITIGGRDASDLERLLANVSSLTISN
ncbi:hypothetical protein Plec18167_006839 [Paecilomyces lecythidis]|uniref:ATP-grasp domain-containing protein n=1 Tax=Paecilomyces lecythidis TaxID=3004212 RepID=A0ABR3X8F5_9EURO